MSEDCAPYLAVPARKVESASPVAAENDRPGVSEAGSFIAPHGYKLPVRDGEGTPLHKGG